MKVRQILPLFGCAAAFFSSARAQSSFDLWDISQGVAFTASSETHPFAGSVAGLLGQYGQDFAEYAWTYYADGQPEGFVHFSEWETPTDVTIGAIRIYAAGDGEWYNNGREFDHVTIKAKSPGSDVYDLTILSVTPTHPYTFVNPANYLLIDEVVTPVVAHSFRAEFTQYTAGYGMDGPRVIEIDGFTTVPTPVPPVSTDLWDVAQGAVVTATTELHPAAGTPAGFLGFLGQALDESAWTYFTDGLPSGTVHSLEWQTSSNVTVGQVRLYAVGDYSPGFNNGREFAQLTLKAKSPGSSTYDLTLLTFTPTHPYTFIDPDNYLMLDATLPAAVTASSFRAEFLQYDAGNGSDGPRIIELDAFAPATPPSDPPPSDPPPSDPPPSDPPPSDPPPSDPPPSDPPPSDPPPSDPPPSDPPPSDPPPSDPPPSDPPPPPVVVPVAITQQPQSVTANLFTPVALWVEATGTAPVRYQWSKDGALLEGQTSQTLYIASVTSAEVGAYQVKVTDANGSTVSSQATIALDLVNILPSSFDAWDSHMGSAITAHSDYAAAGAPYGMFGAGSSADDSGASYFADSQTAFVEWSTRFAAQVSTVRLFARGDVSGHEFGKFTLRAKSPGSATYDIVVGTFTPTHPYTMLDSGTFAILDTEITPIVATAFRADFEQNSANGVRVLELDAFATRPVVKPAIVVNPQSQPLEKKGRALLSVVARGGSLTYQWKFNGVNIAGANSATFCIDAAKRPDQGNYTVVVSNSLGSAESAPAFVTIVNRR